MKAFVSMIAAIGLLAAPAAAEEWQSIRCIPADPSPEEMFDVTQAIDDFEAGPLKWEALHDGQNAKAAVRAIRPSITAATPRSASTTSLPAGKISNMSRSTGSSTSPSPGSEWVFG